MSAISANAINSDVVGTIEGDTVEHQQHITEIRDNEDL